MFKPKDGSLNETFHNSSMQTPIPVNAPSKEEQATNVAPFVQP